ALASWCLYSLSVSFFASDAATSATHTRSLHDALPIFPVARGTFDLDLPWQNLTTEPEARTPLWTGDAQLVLDGLPLELIDTVAGDRKSTRLNSSHVKISYAVFCLKKKTRAARVADTAP